MRKLALLYSGWRIVDTGRGRVGQFLYYTPHKLEQRIANDLTFFSIEWFTRRINWKHSAYSAPCFSVLVQDDLVINSEFTYIYNTRRSWMHARNSNSCACCRLRCNSHRTACIRWTYKAICRRRFEILYGSKTRFIYLQRVTEFWMCVAINENNHCGTRIRLSFLNSN